MNRYSKISVAGAVLVLALIRFYYINWNSERPVNILSYDALGYYMYLPGQFIYHDLGPLNWLPGVLEKYNSAGTLYQISKLPNGNKVIKYPLGIAVLYAPFFAAGHVAAGLSAAPTDGFSPPYQIAICCAAIFYAFLGLWLLRRVLLRFFSDGIAAFVLMLISLGTNYVQYISLDGGMTHGYLFALYAAMLYLTDRWSRAPDRRIALLIGLVFGITTISRPTEAVMLFIPALWRFGDGHQANWRLLKDQYRLHLLLAMSGAFLAMFPQLLYWKTTTGGWIYDVGSKFQFLQPHWRVLFGWEKGWFIYTPLSIFMVSGLFFMKNRPFQRSIWVYVFINTWIVIAWADWRYGASYSCRALVQSYPAWALALACLVEKVWHARARPWLWVAGLGLTGINLFQIGQYKSTILHYNDNNFAYYRAIFLNPHPTPFDMSLLDTDERLDSENGHPEIERIQIDSSFRLNGQNRPDLVLVDTVLAGVGGREHWIQVGARVLSAWGAFDSWIIAETTRDGQRKQSKIRLENGLCKPMSWNPVEFYMRVPAGNSATRLQIRAEVRTNQDVYLEHTLVRVLQ